MRTIAVFSGKGGVGKTTVTANLGVALSTKFNRRVVTVDCNLTTSHLSLYLGMYFVPVSLNNVLRKEADIQQAFYVHSSSLGVVPASLNLRDIKNVEPSDLRKILSSFNDSDIVLLDSAPGLGREAMMSLQACDEVLFVTTPHTPCVLDVAKCCQLLKGMDAKPIGVVLNRVKNQRYELSDSEVAQLTGLPIVAKIPEDDNVLKSVNARMPVVSMKPNSKASKAFFSLAADIIGEKEYKISFFNRLFRRFRKHPEINTNYNRNQDFI